MSVKRHCRLSRRWTRVAGIGLAAITMLTGGTVGVAHWRTQRSVEAGLRQLADGNAAAAVRTFTLVLAGRPDDLHVHYHLGQAYTRLGVLDAAMPHLKKAVQYAPHDATFHRGLGEAYRLAGDTARARREMETAVRLQPDVPAHRIMLAGAMLDGGDVAGAVEQLRMVTHAHPASPAVRLLLARTFALSGDQHRMRRELHEVIRLAPEGALGEIARQEARTRTTSGAALWRRPEQPARAGDQRERNRE